MILTIITDIIFFHLHYHFVKLHDDSMIFMIFMIFMLPCCL